MELQPPTQSVDTAAVATRNNRRATAEHRPPRADSLVDRELTEDDVRMLERAYGYEMARPPSAGLMPLAAHFVAQARASVHTGKAESLLGAMRTMQQGGAPISDALLAAVANRKDADPGEARAYLATHTSREFYA